MATNISTSTRRGFFRIGAGIAAVIAGAVATRPSPASAATVDTVKGHLVLTEAEQRALQDALENPYFVAGSTPESDHTYYRLNQAPQPVRVTLRDVQLAFKTPAGLLPAGNYLTDHGADLARALVAAYQLRNADL
mgnify:CR=1 FL=1